MNDTKNTTTPAEVKAEQANKRTRRSSEAVKQEQRERYLEQIAYHEAVIRDLKKKVEDIDNEQKRQQLFELLKDRNLDELCKMVNVNPNEL